MEPLPTVLTWVRPGVRVDEEVRGESGRPFKAFTADFAVKTSFLWKYWKVILNTLVEQYVCLSTRQAYMICDQVDLQLSKIVT